MQIATSIGLVFLKLQGLRFELRFRMECMLAMKTYNSDQIYTFMVIDNNFVGLNSF